MKNIPVLAVSSGESHHFYNTWVKIHNAEMILMMQVTVDDAGYF